LAASAEVVPLLRYPTDLGYDHETVDIPQESVPSTLAVGRLVHAYLERKLEAGFDRSVLEALWREMAASETDSSPVQRAAVILESFFSGELTDQEGLSFTSRLDRSSILGQETPVFLTIDQQSWHGVIDLVMEDKGTICAVDFKTGVFRTPLPEVYIQQERVYGEAVQRLFPSRDTRFEFWWLGSGHSQ
jgi:ATP-dependent exoDNAse (exonuclease V) beta subunit